MPDREVPGTGKRRRGDFYRTRKWKKLRKQVLRDQHYECQRCKERGKLTRTNLVVHHDLPRENFPEYALTPFLPNGERQLIVLCRECHEEIETERGNRLKISEPLTPEWW